MASRAASVNNQKTPNVGRSELEIRGSEHMTYHGAKRRTRKKRFSMSPNNHNFMLVELSKI